MSAPVFPRAALSAKTMKVSEFPPETTALCEPNCHYRQGTFDHLHRVDGESDERGYEEDGRQDGEGAKAEDLEGGREHAGAFRGTDTVRRESGVSAAAFTRG